MCEYWLHTRSVIALKSSHIHAAGREQSLYEKVNRVNHAAAWFLFLFFLLFRDRVCGKDPLIQKCYLLIAKQCFFMFGDLAAFILCLISMDLPAGFVMEILLPPLSYFPLAPVLHHEP